MAVHLLKMPGDIEPGIWAREKAIDHVGHLFPTWPASRFFTLVVVVCNPGPVGRCHSRALWVTTREEAVKLANNHQFRTLWFTVAKANLDEMTVERTLTDKEHP